MERVSPGAGSPIMWRKLNTPGHDAATFSELEGGAELRGRRSSMATLARLRSLHRAR